MEDNKNVKGGPLKHCSQPTHAKTGFYRDGKCTHGSSDTGSHHVCINIPSARNGNFCTVTDQPNWCEDNMPCHDDDHNKDCKIQNWCVCQWAFARYIQEARGCDNIGTVNCEATNMKAYEAYKDDPSYIEAFECLKKKCGLK